MHEREKLNESRHHLQEMERYVEAPDKFRYALSAFLSAGRSVPQFALIELKNNAGGKRWFDQQIATIPVVRFLKEQRNMSIHERPVMPAAEVNVTVMDIIQFSEAAIITKYDEQGKVIEERGFNSPPLSSSAVSPPLVTRAYFFTDWTGEEDVLTLCHEYVKILDAVLADGAAQGFLTLGC
jgi:hypothetical protein